MNTKNRSRTISAALAGALAIGVLSTLGTGLLARPAPASAHAPEVIDDVLAGAALERAFWACDYLATVHGPDQTPMTECSAASDRLKHERFDGDFARMLEWWRQNKPAEHARLAVAFDDALASRDTR